MSNPFIAVHGDGSGTVVVEVAGEIDMSNADDFERVLGEAIPSETGEAVIDLTRVSYIDSVGLRVLYSLAYRLRTAQIALVLRAPLGSAARRLMELSGLSPVVTLDPPGERPEASEAGSG
ncbi:MAG TPA: STAS domain-containing protein [Acidimicrobiia bacterium]|nr:STAS domain-containing protein [Acidimicrobiia bacterium]